MSVRGLLPTSRLIERASGLGFLRARTHCQQHVLAFAPLLSFFSCSNLKNVSTRAYNPTLFMTASLTWPMNSSERITFFTMHSINSFKSANWLSSTALHRATTVLSTSLLIHYLMWNVMLALMSSAMIWYLVRSSTGPCTTFLYCSLDTAAPAIVWNVFTFWLMTNRCVCLLLMPFLITHGRKVFSLCLTYSAECYLESSTPKEVTTQCIHVSWI